MKKLLTLVFSILMILGLTACGSGAEKEEAIETTKQSGYVYVPEYFDLGLEFGNNDWVDMRGVVGEHMIGMCHTYDDVTFQSEEYFLIMNLRDQTVDKVKLELESEEQYVNAYTLSPAGQIVAIAEEYHWDEKNQIQDSKYFLLTIDMNGQILSSVDFTQVCNELREEYEYFYINTMAVDKDGDLYIGFEQKIIQLNVDGTKGFEIDIPNWLNSMGNMADGSVYAMYYADRGNSLSVIDKTAKAFGKTYNTNGNMNGMFTVGEGNVLCYSDGSSVRKLTLETGESEEVFKWLDSDINGQYIETVVPLDDETFVAYYRNWNTDEEEFVKLVKTDRSTLPEKTILTLATLYDYGGSDFQEKLVQFNKNNSEYRIELKTYFDVMNMSEEEMQNYEKHQTEALTRMMSDLTGKNPPDIISLETGTISANTLVQKGIIEELTPYLEKAGYSEDDFMAGVVNSHKIDGKLYALPAKFSIASQLADSAIVGNKQGWTLEEAMEVLKKLPDDMAFLNRETQQSFVNQCLVYSYDNFIDDAGYSCNFDSPEFKMILEMAKEFPKEYSSNTDWVSEPVLMSDGKLLLANVNIYSLENIQEYLAYLGDKEATFIGFPGVEGNGSLITASSDLYAICSKSKEKDAAAKFIIDIITEEYKESHGWQLPSYEPAFEAYIADQLDIEYVKDENGELVLDEEGNPIPMNGGGSVGYGDWEYTYRPCTEEDAEILRNLINGATGTYNYNTELFAIIMEELEPYFNDQKSVDEVASIIQNRINLYLKENS